MEQCLAQPKSHTNASSHSYKSCSPVQTIYFPFAPSRNCLLRASFPRPSCCPPLTTLFLSFFPLQMSPLLLPICPFLTLQAPHIFLFHTVLPFCPAGRALGEAVWINRKSLAKSPLGRDPARLPVPLWPSLVRVSRSGSLL